MTDAAAIQASFADYRRVKGRKVGQLVFEVPLETFQAAIAALGGEPAAVEERWCAIALLDMSKVKESEVVPDRDASARPHKNGASDGKAKRPWSELSLAQQAGIRCGEQAFWKFLEETYTDYRISNDVEAADFVRRFCHIDSRSDLDKPQNTSAAMAWRSIDTAYQFWLNT